MGRVPSTSASELPERLRYLQPFRRKFASRRPEDLNEAYARLSPLDPFLSVHALRSLTAPRFAPLPTANQAYTRAVDVPPSQPPPATPPPRERRILTRPLWALAIILLVYPLSIGPIIRLLPPGSAKYALLTNLYAPILRVADHSKTLHRFLEWYIYDLWGASPFETQRRSLAPIGLDQS